METGEITEIMDRQIKCSFKVRSKKKFTTFLYHQKCRKLVEIDPDTLILLLFETGHGTANDNSSSDSAAKKSFSSPRG